MARKTSAAKVAPVPAAAPPRDLLAALATAIPRRTVKIVIRTSQRSDGDARQAVYQADSEARHTYGGREQIDTIWGTRNGTPWAAARGLLIRLQGAPTALTEEEYREVNRLIEESNEEPAPCPACAKIRDDAEGKKRLRAQRAALLKAPGVAALEEITGATVTLEQVASEDGTTYTAVLTGGRDLEIHSEDHATAEGALSSLRREVAHELRQMASRIELGVAS